MQKKNNPSLISPAVMKRIKSSIAANHKQQIRNNLEEALKFISLQIEKSAPLRQLYQSAYAGKQALLKRHYGETRKSASVYAGSKKARPVPLFSNRGNRHSSADALGPYPGGIPRKTYRDAVSDKTSSRHKYIPDTEFLYPPFDFTLFPDPTTTGNAMATIGNHITDGSIRPRVAVSIDAEEEGVAFGMLSVGSYFYRDDSGWTEAEGAPGTFSTAKIETTTGDGSYWVIKRIRIDKIFPNFVPGIAAGISDSFASHHIGVNIVHQYSDVGPVRDPLVAGFDRKPGEQFIIWMDILYLASISGGGFTTLDVSWDLTPGGPLFSGSLISVRCF